MWLQSLTPQEIFLLKSVAPEFDTEGEILLLASVAPEFGNEGKAIRIQFKVVAPQFDTDDCVSSASVAPEFDTEVFDTEDGILLLASMAPEFDNDAGEDIMHAGPTTVDRIGQCYLQCSTCFGTPLRLEARQPNCLAGTS